MISEPMTFEHALSTGSAGRHETFTPRYGWLKKGYDRCLANPHVFNDDNAIEQLGVGMRQIPMPAFFHLAARSLRIPTTLSGRPFLARQLMSRNCKGIT